jgi:hypothetical protein
VVHFNNFGDTICVNVNIGFAGLSNEQTAIMMAALKVAKSYVAKEFGDGAGWTITVYRANFTRAGRIVWRNNSDYPSDIHYSRGA